MFSSKPVEDLSLGGTSKLLSKEGKIIATGMQHDNKWKEKCSSCGNLWVHVALCAV